jgi:hypothetical protein
MVFAASALRASSACTAASPDGAFALCGLRPSDISYLRPVLAPVRSPPRTGARSPAIGPETSAGGETAVCFGFACFGFLASRLDRFCPLDIRSSYYPLRSVKEGVRHSSCAQDQIIDIFLVASAKYQVNRIGKFFTFSSQIEKYLENKTRKKYRESL